MSLDIALSNTPLASGRPFSEAFSERTEVPLESFAEVFASIDNADATTTQPSAVEESPAPPIDSALGADLLDQLTVAPSRRFESVSPEAGNGPSQAFEDSLARIKGLRSRKYSSITAATDPQTSNDVKVLLNRGRAADTSGLSKEDQDRVRAIQNELEQAFDQASKLVLVPVTNSTYPITRELQQLAGKETISSPEFDSQFSVTDEPTRRFFDSLSDDKGTRIDQLNERLYEELDEIVVLWADDFEPLDLDQFASLAEELDGILNSQTV